MCRDDWAGIESDGLHGSHLALRQLLGEFGEGCIVHVRVVAQRVLLHKFLWAHKNTTVRRVAPELQCTTFTAQPSPHSPHRAWAGWWLHPSCTPVAHPVHTALFLGTCSMAVMFCSSLRSNHTRHRSTRATMMRARYSSSKARTFAHVSRRFLAMVSANYAGGVHRAKWSQHHNAGR